MAKKIKEKWYVSAGELADYIFCPEHWRLKRLERVRKDFGEESREGIAEHEEWSRGIKRLLVAIRVIRVSLVILTVSVLIAYFFGKFR
ncbi:MAG: hypothetical protein NZO16_06535 [Deltaproteobacteria bacterium]|nr:hypothetical protein [Deltaproteobacteria bacterium]